MSVPSTDFNPRGPDPRMAGLLAAFPPDLFDARLFQSIELAEEYCLHTTIDILQRLGAEPPLASGCSVDDLHARLRLAPVFRAPLIWLLQRLAAAGLVAIEGDKPAHYRSCTAWTKPQLRKLRARAAEIDATNGATFDLLDAAAAAYPRIAHGEVDGASALLAAEHINLWLAYFNNDHPLYALNNRVSAIAAAERLAGERPIDQRPLRILEIGAGAGSGTECLLQELACCGLLDRVEHFLVTEPSAFFRRRGARSLSASYPGVPLEFAALDIDAPWATQGAPRGAFDLVFGVNVLHVATDLPFTLSEVRAALAPGGWLVAGECLRPYPHYPIYIELVFQVLDSFVDVVTDPELRPRPGFLTPEEWRRLLVQAGFGRIELSPDHIATREIYPKLFVGALCARRHDGSEKVGAHASTSAMGS